MQMRLYAYALPQYYASDSDSEADGDAGIVRIAVRVQDAVVGLRSPHLVPRIGLGLGFALDLCTWIIASIVIVIVPAVDADAIVVVVVVVTVAVRLTDELVPA
jgi:hypothetical protein